VAWGAECLAAAPWCLRREVQKYLKTMAEVSPRAVVELSCVHTRSPPGPGAVQLRHEVPAEPVSSYNCCRGYLPSFAAASYQGLLRDHCCSLLSLGLSQLLPPWTLSSPVPLSSPLESGSAGLGGLFSLVATLSVYLCSEMTAIPVVAALSATMECARKLDHPVRW
jgi:hypothetical protein